MENTNVIQKMIHSPIVQGFVVVVAVLGSGWWAKGFVGSYDNQITQLRQDVDALQASIDSGIVGAVGPQGPRGLTGPQGPEGQQGTQGPAGPAGPAGLQGEQGESGPQGLPGLPGRNISSSDDSPEHNSKVTLMNVRTLLQECEGIAKNGRSPSTELNVRRTQRDMNGILIMGTIRESSVSDAIESFECSQSAYDGFVEFSASKIRANTITLD